MPKYSTGSGSGNKDEKTCELCGKKTVDLVDTTIEGASLSVCSECTSHGERDIQDQDSTDNSRESTIQRATNRRATLWDSDTSHWETEGAGYQDDPLPYLASDYADTVTTARKNHDLTVSELAQELGVDEMVILAIEDGQAISEEIPGSIIEAVEEELEIDITENPSQ